MSSAAWINGKISIVVIFCGLKFNWHSAVAKVQVQKNTIKVNIISKRHIDKRIRLVDLIWCWASISTPFFVLCSSPDVVMMVYIRLEDYASAQEKNILSLSSAYCIAVSSNVALRTNDDFKLLKELAVVCFLSSVLFLLCHKVGWSGLWRSEIAIRYMFGKGRLNNSEWQESATY